MPKIINMNNIVLGTLGKFSLVGETDTKHMLVYSISSVIQVHNLQSTDESMEKGSS